MGRVDSKRFPVIRVPCLSGNNRSDRLDWSNAGKFEKKKVKKRKGKERTKTKVEDKIGIMQ